MMAERTRTQVAIVGAGPAGLMLSHLLHRSNIESIVLESQSRAYVERRVRAGVLECGTVELLEQTGLGERLHREGLLHRGIELRFEGRSHRIDFEELTGKAVIVYGQQEVVKDLIAARLAAGAALFFNAKAVAVCGVADERATVSYVDESGSQRRIEADFIVGCDGFHGICRAAMPQELSAVFEHVYPFSWLGILAESPPVSEELIYTNHSRGFALVSMRSPSITRLYLQCSASENIDDWPDERFWSELRARLGSDSGGPAVVSGRVLQKSITPMRSFVTEPMRYGRLFLAGDAAHIVPPTGAKGMNMAIADVRLLASALDRFFHTGTTRLLDDYSATCLRRVWRTQRFSAWMTQLLHRFDTNDAFEQRIKRTELEDVTTSRAAARSLAEQYVGLSAS